MNDGLAVRFGEELARHTPARTGGACEAFVVVHREEALLQVLADCRQASWRWTVLGAGTRTVVRDGPVQGVVFRLGTDFARLERLEARTWRVGAAYPVPALLEALAREGHSGLEPLAGVAGSVGASLLHEDAWSEAVESVQTVVRGRYREVPLSEIGRRKGKVVTHAVLTLRQDTPKRVRSAMARHLGRTRTGSWYAGPPKADLRQVLRSAQLPMVRLRRVAIPDAAPELLINLGGGTAADLALLHRSATERVKRVRGIDLRPTVRWVGTRDDERA